MRDLGLVEQSPSLDLVGGQLPAGGKAVDLLGLAAQDGSEFVDSEEGRKDAHGFEYTKQKCCKAEILYAQSDRLKP